MRRDLADALRAKGRSAAAIHAVKRVIALEPKDTEAYRALGVLYLGQGWRHVQSKDTQKAKVSFESSATAYRKLIALEPEAADIRLELGQAEQQAGNLRAAIAAYQEFLRLAPRDANAPLVRALVRRLAKQAG
jgi:regulator of sirC expression with transglutaminase-like and TPR domain